jgi:hypothetical protein
MIRTKHLSQRRGVDGINNDDGAVNWLISPELEIEDGVMELE